MRFKDFIEFASMMHGGIGNPLGDFSPGNGSLGIDSKYYGPEGKIKKQSDACKFGNPKNCKTPESQAVDKFGFKNSEDKEGSKERRSGRIDNRDTIIRQNVPLT